MEAPPHRIVDCVAGRPIHNFQVVSTEKLTRHVVRVVLGGRGFDTFSPIDYTDAYVKILFIDGHIDVAALPQPLTLDSFSSFPRVATGRPHLPPSAVSVANRGRSQSIS